MQRRRQLLISLGASCAFSVFAGRDSGSLAEIRDNNGNALQMQLATRQGLLRLHARRSISRTTESLRIDAHYQHMSVSMEGEATSRGVHVRIRSGRESLYVTIEATPDPQVALMRVTENGSRREYRINLETLVRTRNLADSIIGPHMRRLQIGANLPLKLPENEFRPYLERSPEYRRFMEIRPVQPLKGSTIPWWCIFCYSVPLYGVVCLLIKSCR